MLSFLLFIAVYAATTIIGAVGWPQIVGSIRQFYPARLFTIVLWLAILGGGWYLCNHFFPSQIIALCIGYGITLVLTLREDKIE